MPENPQTQWHLLTSREDYSVSSSSTHRSWVCMVRCSHGSAITTAVRASVNAPNVQNDGFYPQMPTTTVSVHESPILGCHFNRIMQHWKKNCFERLSMQKMLYKYSWARWHATPDFIQSHGPAARFDSSVDTIEPGNELPFSLNTDRRTRQTTLKTSHFNQVVVISTCTCFTTLAEPLLDPCGIHAVNRSTYIIVQWLLGLITDALSQI